MLSGEGVVKTSAPVESRRERREPSAELNRLAHELIGAAIEVHRVLGPGLFESVYEEALCVELNLRDVPFKRQAGIDLQYK